METQPGQNNKGRFIPKHFEGTAWFFILVINNEPYELGWATAFTKTVSWCCVAVTITMSGTHAS